MFERSAGQDRDWCVVDQKESGDIDSKEQLVDLDFLNEIFPDRDSSTLKSWLTVLVAEEIRCADDILAVAQDEKAWAQLGLPLVVRIKLRQAAQNAAKPQVSTAAISLDKEDPIQQVDCIVLDVSASMKARSAIDARKTREDLSKLVFLSMVDGILSLEMDHAVSLVSFGKDVSVVGEGVSRHYEQFQKELGRLDADQGRTRLYDGIVLAAKTLLEFKAAHADQLVDECPLRLFALTDGLDNASSIQPWQAVEFLQKHDIVLDSFPMAGHHPKLQAASTATGGICVNVSSEEQAVGMFQREALLHISTRRQGDIDSSPPRRVTCQQDLENFIDDKKVVEDVCSVKPNPIMNAETSGLAEAIGAARSGGGVHIKRILKEYKDMMGRPAHPLLHYYPLQGDPSKVKIILQGPENTPYQGYFFGLSAEFSSNYPWKPVRVRFLTEIYHCNINRDGGICLDILKDRWSPALTLDKIMLSILSLLEKPNPDDPLVPYIAQVYKEDKRHYEVEAASHARQHAFASIEAAKAALSVGSSSCVTNAAHPSPTSDSD